MMKLAWLHLTNRTGNTVEVWFAGRVEVPVGRWCLGAGKEPHCQPKEKERP